MTLKNINHKNHIDNNKMNKSMAKQVIRITENEMKRIINESTKKILKEFSFQDDDYEFYPSKNNFDQRWKAIIKEYGPETVLNAIPKWINSDLLEEIIRAFESGRHNIGPQSFTRY